MQIIRYDNFENFTDSPWKAKATEFIHSHPKGGFFQCPAFFEFIATVPGYQPTLWLVINENDQVVGSLLGVLQSNGKHIKSWLSRRMICWGGPLVIENNNEEHTTISRELLNTFQKDTAKSAIYAEFRNFFDTSNLEGTFKEQGFTYKPHLNFLVKTDELSAVKKRMSNSRWRQIKSTLKLGATIVEPENDSDVQDFYEILQELYREKVKKPLPDYQLFSKFWKSDLAKIFLVKFEGKVVGGILCPIYQNQIIYEWYVCGKDGLVKGLYPSVLATWAPIEYGLENGYNHFDFMGAGKPDEDYGVREFKARFGGEQVSFGRYEIILNNSLYQVGKLGLQLYKKIS